MNTLLVCERDPECGWASIARADSLLDAAKAIRERHHAKHDRKEATRLATNEATAMRRAEWREKKRRTRALKLAVTPAGVLGKNKDAQVGGVKGSAPLRPVCSCCVRGLWGVHGVGHTGPLPLFDADVAS